MSRFWKVALGTLGIVFLVLILFPIFQRVPENSFHPANGCMSNMKQLGLALVQYSQDNNETLPPATTAAGKGWREATYPYAKATGLYRCPDDPRDAERATPESLPKSYGANAATLTGSSLVTFSEPSQTLMVTDTRGYEGEEWSMTSPAFLPGTGRELYAHFPKHPFYEHPSGGLNVLYSDGHVKRLPPMNTLTPTNLWTRDNAPFAGQDLANAQAILTHAEKE